MAKERSAKTQKALDALAKAMLSTPFDLHLHSYYSDGSDSPSELLFHALERRLKLIALSDHDTLLGISSLLAAGRKMAQIGFEVPTILPAVELSTRYTLNDAASSERCSAAGEPWTELHLLAYFPCGGYESLQDFLLEQQAARDRRNRLIFEKLQALGYKVEHGDLKKNFAHGVLGRPHIAGILVRKDYFLNVSAVFDALLAEGKPAYVPRELPRTEAVIKHILNCGGVPILAHPYLYDWTDPQKLEGHLLRLRAAGLLGVELIHGGTPASYSQVLGEVLAPLHLLPTGGSDYHGIAKPAIRIFDEATDYSLHRRLLESFFGF